MSTHAQNIFSKKRKKIKGEKVGEGEHFWCFWSFLQRIYYLKIPYLLTYVTTQPAAITSNSYFSSLFLKSLVKFKSKGSWWMMLGGYEMILKGHLASINKTPMGSFRE